MLVDRALRDTAPAFGADRSLMLCLFMGVLARAQEDPEALLLRTQVLIEDGIDGLDDDAFEVGILGAEHEARWIEPEVLVRPRDRGTVVADDAPSLDLTTERALQRVGISFDETLAPRQLERARFFPWLSLLGRLEHQRAADASYEADETTGGRDARWLLAAQLCVGLCGGTVADLEVVDDADVEDALIAVGGKVYAIDDAAAQAPAAADVANDLSAYRTHVADTIADLYALRRTLLAHGDTSLSGAVDRALAIARVEARLDLYSDGAFTRSLEGACCR